MSDNIVHIVEECCSYSEWYKCKRCKAQFKIERLNSIYAKDVNFCPYCGIVTKKQHKGKHQAQVVEWQTPGT